MKHAWRTENCGYVKTLESRCVLHARGAIACNRRVINGGGGAYNGSARSNGGARD